MTDTAPEASFAQFAGRSVLITGGLGFIGSNLALRLLDLGAHVLLVDSLWPDYGGTLANIDGFADRVQVNISDVRDRYSFRQLVRNQDFMFNLAGQTSHMDSMADPFTDLDINCRSQLSILETCRHHNPEVKVVFASTRQIYGKPDTLPVDESHRLSPVDVNGINKMAGERYHILYSEVYGVRASVLRLTNTYGPRMRIKDARQTFLGVWLRLVLEGRPLEVWGGSQLRDFTYVDDAVTALLLAAIDERADGTTFNLGGCEVVSLSRLAELLVDANAGGGFSVTEFPSDRKLIDIGDYYADYGLITQVLGWSPEVPLADGLSRTLDYFRPRLDRYV